MSTMIPAPAGATVTQWVTGTDDDDEPGRRWQSESPIVAVVIDSQRVQWAILATGGDPVQVHGGTGIVRWGDGGAL